MVITEEARNHLYNTLREKFGPQDAATMMDLLPPVGWADVARQRDFDRLEAAMGRRFDELGDRFATRDDLREQTNRFIGWMVASNATLVATVALVTSLR